MELQDLASKNVRSRRDPNDHLALGFMVRRAPHPRDTKSVWGLGVFAAFWYLDSACQIFPGTLKASSERDQHSEGTTRNQEKEEEIYTYTWRDSLGWWSLTRASHVDKPELKSWLWSSCWVALNEQLDFSGPVFSSIEGKLSMPLHYRLSSQAERACRNACVTQQVGSIA